MKSLVLLGLLVGSALSAPLGPASPVFPLPANPGYFPPNWNGLNPDHKCDGGTGVCVQGNNVCEQHWTDGDGDQRPSKGDKVWCRNTAPGAW